MAVINNASLILTMTNTSTDLIVRLMRGLSGSDTVTIGKNDAIYVLSVLTGSAPTGVTTPATDDPVSLTKEDMEKLTTDYVSSGCKFITALDAAETMPGNDDLYSKLHLHAINVAIISAARHALNPDGVPCDSLDKLMAAYNAYMIALKDKDDEHNFEFSCSLGDNEKTLTVTYAGYCMLRLSAMHNFGVWLPVYVNDVVTHIAALKFKARPKFKDMYLEYIASHAYEMAERNIMYGKSEVSKILCDIAMANAHGSYGLKEAFDAMATPFVPHPTPATPSTDEQ